jgi:hypothetical protein
MRFPWKWAGLALPVAVLFACERQPAPTAAAASVTSYAGPTAADFMNNPDNGNPRFYRYQSDFGISWSDPTSGLRATHWTFPAQAGCGDWPQGVMDVQEVALDLTDPLAGRVLANAVGDVWIKVRDTNQAGDCFGSLLVAEGPGTLHYTDNDEYAFLPNDRSSLNGFGYMATGTLTTPDGRTVKYSGHLRMAYDPDLNTAKGSAQVNLH